MSASVQPRVRYVGARSAALRASDPAGIDVREVLAGLTAPQKRLPPKYFYDRRGSELFDRICELDEYYPTRTELAVMRRHADEIAALVGPRGAIVELGAGSNAKVRLLLDHLTQPAVYMPIDISAEYLRKQAADLAADYPALCVQPLFADFTRPLTLPAHPVRSGKRLLFFPGSTIGNFTRSGALELLESIAPLARGRGALLIGVDLRKDAATLHAAYNDSLGVTAEFNLNVLARLNRELDADFDLERFRHEAIYDAARGRIEMRLISLHRQTATLAGVEIPFEDGEHIVTEYSHKYSVAEFQALARRAGFVPQRCWTDDDSLFSVHYLSVE